MAAPKLGERVATLEAEWRVYRTETFPDFRKDLDKKFDRLGDKIDNAQLNGQTGRVKNMAVVLGDSEDVEILASMVESHKRWSWAFGPLTHARQGILNAALYFSTGLAVAGLNAIVHARFPSIP